MTKAQQKQIENIRTYVELGDRDLAARIISILIRSAMRKQDLIELMAHADALGLTTSPEFIV